MMASMPHSPMSAAARARFGAGCALCDRAAIAGSLVALEILAVLFGEVCPEVDDTVGIEMQLEKSFGIDGVASLERIDDCFVFLNALRVVEVEMRAEMPDPIVMRLRGLDHLPDFEISRDLDHCAMKGIVGKQESLVIPTLRVALLVRDDLTQASDV